MEISPAITNSNYPNEFRVGVLRIIGKEWKPAPAITEKCNKTLVNFLELEQDVHADRDHEGSHR